jgi:uncharacterized protein (TIGR00251 family)
MWIRPENDGTVLVCRVRPNAGRNSIEGIRENGVSVHLSAPAVEGKANKALVAFLAKRLHIAKSKISLKTGEKARTKVLVISGLTPKEVAGLLELSLPPLHRDNPTG